jgi:DMSO reductase anchor subunit
MFWRAAQTIPRFFGSALLLGAAAAVALGIAPTVGAVIIAIATVGKLACDARVMRPLDDTDEETIPTPAITTARLLSGPLRAVFGLRIVGALLAGLFLATLTLAEKLSASGTWTLFFIVLAADLTERYLFFRAVDAPKMPGLPTMTGGRHA